MKIAYGLIRGTVVILGLGLCGLPARADVYTSGNIGRTELPTIKSSDDAVSSIPILSKLSRSFLIGDGFKFKLSGTELRIDHMGSDSRAPASKRNCMLSLTFSSPVAFFGSNLEMPIFNAPTLSWSDWNVSTMGDYVLHLSKDAAVEHPTVGLMASARF